MSTPELGSSRSVVCPACGILARVTNRGEISRHGGVRIVGSREVACLLSGASASASHEELAEHLEIRAAGMDEHAGRPGTTPRERDFYRAAAGRARLHAVRLRRGILPRPDPRARAGGGSS